MAEMSAGAVVPEPAASDYTREERMLMATELLKQRIKDIMEARKLAGKIDSAPQLVDMGTAHILYVPRPRLPERTEPTPPPTNHAT